MKITVYVATVLHRHGHNQYSGATEDDVRYAVDIYCQENAKNEGVNLTPEMTTTEVIDAYFDHVEDESVSFDQHEIDFALPAPIAGALKNASATIGLMDDQISQMEGMFSDEDGQIAEAREEGDKACEQIEAVLAHYETGAPLPVPEIYISMDGGLIHEVNSTGSLVGASYTIIDYDVDGAEEVHFIERADGTVTEACIGGGSVGEFTSKIVAEAEGDDE